MTIDSSIALVTGANRGIGRALVEELLAQGAVRVYAAARDLNALGPVVALDRSRVRPLGLDITDPADLAAAALAARDITLLINNAGVLDFGSVLDVTDTALRRDMEVNYFGTLAAARAFAPALAANGGGALVNVLTLVALASMPGLGAYNASKAAAWSMTQSLRADLGKRGTKVHAVFPGAVDTDMLKGVEMPKTSPADIARAIVAGVVAGDEDIFPDPMSRQMYAAWAADHKAVERQFATM